MVNLTPNPSYSLTIRLELPNQAGTLASVTQAIASVGGSLGQISLLEKTLKISTREITVDAYSTEHAEKIVTAVKALPDIKVLKISDRTFDLHRKGKISMEILQVLHRKRSPLAENNWEYPQKTYKQAVKIKKSKIQY